MMRNALVLSAMAAAAFGGPITYSVAVIPPVNGASPYTYYGINDSGQVAGSGFPVGPNSQAVIASPAGSTAIPSPTGWSNVYGEALNSSGQVVGYGQNPAVSPGY
jgi:hypothetical protein